MSAEGRLAPSEDSSKGARYEDNVLEHCYDGIEEYDNPLPAWWVNIFWATFVFAILYYFHYHISGQGASVQEAYAEEVAAFEAEQAKRAMKDTVSEESLARLAANTGAVAAGREVYQARCQACHADGGQGLIGPNLTDAYWLHGKGTLMDIYGVVRDGAPAKGMPAWGRQLSPTELRQVVAFAGTLRGAELAGKAPEGEKVSPAGAPDATTTSGAEGAQPSRVAPPAAAATSSSQSPTPAPNSTAGSGPEQGRGPTTGEK